MKNILIVTLFVLQSFVPQNKTYELANGSTVSYNVDEKGIKSGVYNILDKSKKLILRGSYVNGSRSGDWYCFDDAGNVLLRYNYSLKKLITLDDKLTSNFEYKIVSDDNNVIKNARIPVAITSPELLKSIVVSNLINQMPAKLKSNKISVDGIATVLIGNNGSSKYIVKYLIDGFEYKTIVDVRDKVFEVEWIPSSYNGVNYKSEVSFAVKFNIDPSDSRRFIWNY